MSNEKDMFNLLDITRGKITPDQATDLTLGMLAISNGEASKLRRIASNGNIKEAVLNEIHHLSLTKKTIKQLINSVDSSVKLFSMADLADFTMALARLLEWASAVELADQVIMRIDKDKAGMGRLTKVPKQVTEVVSLYFNMPANSTLYSAMMEIGITATDLMSLNPEISFYGQGFEPHACMLGELRFYIGNIKAQLACGDVISDPKFVEHNALKRFDYVYMSPPFGMKPNKNQELAIESDIFNIFDYYGKPSKMNVDLAYVISGLGALKEDGKAAFFIPTGPLFRGGADQKIRERFLYADIIEAVIALPPGLLAPYSGVSTALVLFNKNKQAERRNKIMMINAENLFEAGPSRSTKVLTKKAMDLINNALTKFEEVGHLSRIIAVEELKDAQLLPSHYVFEAAMDFEEYGKVKFDLAAFQELNTVPLKKLANLYRGYNALPRNIEENGPYAVLKIADVENGEIDYDNLSYYKVEERTKVDNYRIQKGDIILAIRGQSLKAAIFEQERDDVLLSQNFVGIRCGQDLDPYFLKMYIESPTVQFVLNSKLTGSTVMNLPIKEVEALPIPVLPINQQRDIVEQYNNKQKQISDEIKALQEQIKKLKLESYNAMGLKKTFIL